MITGRKVTISVRENFAGEYHSTYEVHGVLLDDGRLVTFGTGDGGRDSLWRDIPSYAPNGTDEYESHVVHEEPVDVSLDDLREADHDNVTFGVGTLLTNEEA